MSSFDCDSNFEAFFRFLCSPPHTRTYYWQPVCGPRQAYNINVKLSGT